MRLKKPKKTTPTTKLSIANYSRLKAALDRHFTALQSQHGRITPLMLKNVFNNLPVNQRKGKPKELRIKRTLLGTADEVIAQFAKMVTKKLRSPHSLRQWRSTRNKIVEFLKYEYSCSDIELCDIEPSFGQRFYDYLTIHREVLLQEAAGKKTG